MFLPCMLSRGRHSERTPEIKVLFLNVISLNSMIISAVLVISNPPHIDVLSLAQIHMLSITSIAQC